MRDDDMPDNLARGQVDATARLDSPAALAEQLAALLATAPDLVPVAERAGSFEIRRIAPGFGGLARIVVGQQVSTASADAIWQRFSALDGALTPAGYLALEEAAIRTAGFSAAKFHTLTGVARALVAGELALEPLAELPAATAIAQLTQLKGIGPWTAELYLMFSAGHPDIFPAGDVALQQAVQWAFALDARPAAADLIARATRWSPYRSTAALLFWRYYRAIRNREGVPVG